MQRFQLTGDGHIPPGPESPSEFRVSEQIENFWDSGNFGFFSFWRRFHRRRRISIQEKNYSVEVLPRTGFLFAGHNILIPRDICLHDSGTYFVRLAPFQIRRKEKFLAGRNSFSCVEIKGFGFLINHCFNAWFRRVSRRATLCTVKCRFRVREQYEEKNMPHSWNAINWIKSPKLLISKIRFIKSFFYNEPASW